MTPWHAPWMELAILAPLIGAFWVRWLTNPDQARRHSLIFTGLTLAFAALAWWNAGVVVPAPDPGQSDVVARWLAQRGVAIDLLSAPLLPLSALLYLLTVLATLRTKVRRFSFAGLLASEAILLATFCCQQPWEIAALLALGTIPTWYELWSNNKPTRVFSLHMGLFILLLVGGQTLVHRSAAGSGGAQFGYMLLLVAVLIRSGLAPLHCWMTDLFEHASFGTSLLFVTPMVGAYAALRLLLPAAPEWILQSLSAAALVTAVYAAGMALVQHEARRFFCYLFLSHSSLVFVGLAIATPISLTGALYVWLSVGLSLAGFGLTLRSIEARTGRLSLDEFHGLYEHTPALATLFLLTGLASIGFPGTVGFVGTELLVDGAVMGYPLAGAAIVVAAALNGLAVMQAYFRVFTGTRHFTSIDLGIRLPERIAVLILTALILGGGLYPQPGVASRYDAAEQLVAGRVGTSKRPGVAHALRAPRHPPLSQANPPAELAVQVPAE